MTIAAGLPHLEGLLLCADTELTAGDLKLHARKVARFNCPFGRVGMVCAGHFSNATATMHKIGRALRQLDPSIHPLETIEKVLDREYPRIVWSNPYPDSSAFWLIFSIQQTGGQPELFVSDEVTIRQSMSPECVGSGAVVARQIIEAGASALTSSESAGILATYMLSHAKRHASGVGGSSLLMDFCDDGSFSEFTDDPYLKTLEDYFGIYQGQAWNLALAMTTPRLSDEDFAQSLEAFNEKVVSARQEWAELRAQHQRNRERFRVMTRPREK